MTGGKLSIKEPGEHSLQRQQSLHHHVEGKGKGLAYPPRRSSSSASSSPRWSAGPSSPKHKRSAVIDWSGAELSTAELVQIGTRDFFKKLANKLCGSCMSRTKVWPKTELGSVPNTPSSVGSPVHHSPHQHIQAPHHVVAQHHISTPPPSRPASPKHRSGNQTGVVISEPHQYSHPHTIPHAESKGKGKAHAHHAPSPSSSSSSSPGWTPSSGAGPSTATHHKRSFIKKAASNLCSSCVPKKVHAASPSDSNNDRLLIPSGKIRTFSPHHFDSLPASPTERLFSNPPRHPGGHGRSTTLFINETSRQSAQQARWQPAAKGKGKAPAHYSPTPSSTSSAASSPRWTPAPGAGTSQSKHADSPSHDGKGKGKAAATLSRSSSSSSSSTVSPSLHHRRDVQKRGCLCQLKGLMCSSCTAKPIHPIPLEEIPAPPERPASPEDPKPRIHWQASRKPWFQPGGHKSQQGPSFSPPRRAGSRFEQTASHQRSGQGPSSGLSRRPASRFTQHTISPPRQPARTLTIKEPQRAAPSQHTLATTSTHTQGKDKGKGKEKAHASPPTSPSSSSSSSPRTPSPPARHDRLTPGAGPSGRGHLKKRGCLGKLGSKMCSPFTAMPVHPIPLEEKPAPPWSPRPRIHRKPVARPRPIPKSIGLGPEFGSPVRPDREKGHIPGSPIREPARTLKIKEPQRGGPPHHTPASISPHTESKGKGKGTSASFTQALPASSPTHRPPVRGVSIKEPTLHSQHRHAIVEGKGKGKMPAHHSPPRSSSASSSGSPERVHHHPSGAGGPSGDA